MLLFCCPVQQFNDDAAESGRPHAALLPECGGQEFSIRIPEAFEEPDSAVFSDQGFEKCKISILCGKYPARDGRLRRGVVHI